MLLFYVVMILLSAFIINSTMPVHSGCIKSSISFYRPTLEDDYNGYEIELYGLKNDNSIQTLNLSDFKIKYGKNTRQAKFFSKTRKESFDSLSGTTDTYSYVCDGSTKTFYVYFDEEINSYLAELYFKGELIDYESRYQNAETKILITCLIETFVFALVFGITCAVLANRGKQKTGENFKKINERAIQEFKERGFKSTKTYYLPASKSGKEDIEKMMLMVDNKNKRFALIDYASLVGKIVDFGEIVDYKLIEKNSTDVKTNLGYSILFDDLYTTTSSTEVCKKLQLVFVLNNEEDTNLVYDIIKSGISLDSEKYKTISKMMIEITALLDILKSSASPVKRFIYCKYCGAKNDANDKKCDSCGSNLN